MKRNASVYVDMKDTVSFLVNYYKIFSSIYNSVNSLNALNFSESVKKYTEHLRQC